jgi:hypothetical protein
MNLTPEILGALRILLMTAGSFAVGKGWLPSTELDALVGGLVAAVAAWAIYAKRSTNVEARIIAGRVETKLSKKAKGLGL